MGNNNFEQLVEKISNTHLAMQRGAVYAVNKYLSVRNWLFGYYIVEFEQNGSDRAKYGEKLIDELSKSLRKKGIRGVAPTPLRICRTFYLTYPQIQPTVSTIFQSVDSQNNISFSIQPTVSVELKNTENADVYEKDLPPELLLSQLSFSHSTADMSENMFVSKYLIKLPDKQTLEKIVSSNNNKI